MVLENAKFVTKIEGTLTASIAGSFILICVSCALCWLHQAMSLFFPPPPASFLGKTCCIFPSKLCFQLHSISSMLSMQRMRQAELKSWRAPYSLSLKVLHNGSQRRMKDSEFFRTHYKFSDSDSWLSSQTPGFIFCVCDISFKVILVPPWKAEEFFLRLRKYF